MEKTEKRTCKGSNKFVKFRKRFCCFGVEILM